MAHIPYGYKIERGKAVIVPEEAERIRTFLNAYLDGLSIKNAGAEAEIPLATSALRKMLSSEVWITRLEMTTRSIGALFTLCL